MYVYTCTFRNILHSISTRIESQPQNAGPRSAIGNVSGYRCVSDCRSRGREFDPGRSHTFVEIDHKMISMVILLPSPDSFKKGCCQLQAKVCPGKSVVR